MIARAISRYALGAVLVRGSQGRCLGIIVDGDLRRALATGGAGRLKASDLMTRHPQSVAASAPASEALQKMEDRAVYQILVTGPRGRVVGLVHIHDLLGRGRVRFAPDGRL